MKEEVDLFLSLCIFFLLSILSPPALSSLSYCPSPSALQAKCHSDDASHAMAITE